ncbi:MAG: AAA family ATPase [Armatimonadetes bacterium]|nr:AAA family ATPase [Armatimonadota bacterium]
MGFEWIKVENFRCLNHLHIEQLGQVNLITGRNSVGKSYLLEALELCGAEATLATLLRQMAERGQLAQAPERTGGLRSFGELPRHRFDTLFYGWPADLAPVEATLAADRGQATLALALCQSHGLDGPEEDLRICLTRNGHAFSLGLFERDPVAAALRGELLSLAPRGDHADGSTICSRWRLSDPDLERLAKTWEKVALLPAANAVLGILRLACPELTGIQFAESPSGRREPQVELRDVAKPVPLGSAGDGVRSLLAAAIALATAEGGVLLLDGVGAGLHYSVHCALWPMICATARDLNIQVFATTHDWDCVLAFRQALAADPAVQGCLHRLQALPEAVLATTFDEQRLAASTDRDLELR